MQLSAMGLLLPSHKTGRDSVRILHPCLETLKRQQPRPFCPRWAGLWPPPSHRARDRPGTPAGRGAVQGRPTGQCKKCRHGLTGNHGEGRPPVRHGGGAQASRGTGRREGSPAPLLPRGIFSCPAAPLATLPLFL